MALATRVRDEPFAGPDPEPKLEVRRETIHVRVIWTHRAQRRAHAASLAITSGRDEAVHADRGEHDKNQLGNLSRLHAGFGFNTIA